GPGAIAGYTAQAIPASALAPTHTTVNPLLRRLICTAALAMAPWPAAAQPAPAGNAADLPYAGQPAAMAFADDLAERRGLDPAWVRQQIGQAVRLERVTRLVLPPPTSQPKNWAAYRARFIEPRRIQAGLQFWQAHREALAR